MSTVLWAVLWMGAAPQGAMLPVDASVGPPAIVAEGPPVRPLMAFRSRTRRSELHAILQQHSLATGIYDSQGRYELVQHAGPPRPMSMLAPVFPPPTERIPTPVPMPAVAEPSQLK